MGRDQGAVMDLDSWRAFGGRVEGKVYVGPAGERLKSWKAAAKLMAEGKKDASTTGTKRAAEAEAEDAAAPDNKSDKENSKKTKASKKPKASITPAANDADDIDVDGDAMTTDAAGAAGNGADAADDVDTDKAEQAVGSGRRAAQGAQYKDNSGARACKDDYIVYEEEPEAESEAAAIRETQGERPSITRRLVQFTVTDKAGITQPLDRLDLLNEPIFVTGAVYPEEGTLSNKSTGRRISNFGPVKSWSLAPTSGNATGPVIRLTTHLGCYILSRPLPAYKKIWQELQAQAALAAEVMQIVDPGAGGSASASFDEVVSRLARQRAIYKGYASAREALLLNGKFILQQLSAADAARRSVTAPGKEKDKGKGAAGATEWAFFKGLEAELAKGPVATGTLMTANGGIKIADGSSADGDAAAPGDDLVAADEEMARRLQAQMDTQAYGAAGGNRGRAGAGGAGAAYIKISEEEIADDYPMPKQYNKEEEEMDELALLWDEELAQLDPDALPRRLITDFSVYNSEGFMTTLELLPMWSGVDPDEEIFVSGVVKDDDGDWGVGGQGLGQDEHKQDKKPDQAQEGAGGSCAGGSGGSGCADAGGSGSAAGSGADATETAPHDPIMVGGTRMFLSQIREWVVEYSADQLFLSIRTDAGWYRLCRPSTQYAPWFRAPLKSARLAVKVIGLLSEAERTSRLSFVDVIKRLAEEPEGSALFISKNKDRVERFVVVHGQIFLNQIKNFPKKAVQQSPFVKGLKTAMEARRHNKLYYSKKGFSRAMRVTGVNRNPMKDRASGRSKPMPATATRMVHSIWENYFGVGEGGSGPQADAAAGAVAEEVEEDPNDEEEEQQADAQEDALAGRSSSGRGKKGKAAVKKGQAVAAKGSKAKPTKPEWVGASIGTDSEGRALYKAAKVGSWQVALGDAITLPSPADSDDEDDIPKEAAARDTDGDVQMGEDGKAAAKPAKVSLPPAGLVQCFLQEKSGERSVQVRMLLPGAETVLGDAAADAELFVTDDYIIVPLAGLTGTTLNAKRLERAWSADLRGHHFEEDEALRKANKEAAAAGKPLRYFYRHCYRPQQGMFCALPEDMGLGEYVAPPTPPVVLGLLPGNRGFIKEGVSYAVGDCLFLQPNAFDVSEGEDSSSEEEEEEEEAGSDASSSESEGESSEQEEEEEEKPATGKGTAAKKAAEGKRRQPARIGTKAATAKGKAAGSDDEMEDAEGCSGSDSDDAADEDFKAKGKGIRRTPKAAASNKAPAAKKPVDKKKSKKKTPKRSSKSKGKDVQYADGRKGRFTKGSCEGLRAYVVARVVEVKSSSSGKGSTPSQILVERYYRPEDVSADTAYKAGLWDLYAAPAPAKGKSPTECAWVQWVKPSQVVSKCVVGAVGSPKDAEVPTFEVVGTYNPTTKATTEPPAKYAAGASSSGKGKAAASDKGKGKASTTAAADQSSADDGLAMATMDIFAGCGGLSEGMHQAGVADTKWAIEYEAPAADAFKLNNPDAEVFCANCNVILRAAMEKAGLTSDCCAHEDAIQGALQMTPDRIAALPKPGEVEFIMGGPPCQGYSGMNRFNKSNWSMVQNSMVMAFLSYADFYRPRYFLLENVRNFVSHNKSFTFRLTLRTLLDMGYQVRFGVLNAGNYGVPQSRKRTFIWAAAPEEQLPSWPQQEFVFRSPQLTINLPGGVAYTAVPQQQGAPLRTVTVCDAIGDLPPIKNGHDQDTMPYTTEASSAFQKKIRNGATVLRDHICKEMNPLNLERCRCIPKNTPGADWRVLLDIVKNDPSREKFNGQPLVPWCLPNTADRHNGWRGLFGRLDMAGHFPTSTTDPQPMGKVGQVFHPDQDRIVSVRECARSQGFPDTFFFSGNVHSRHRQVGNAVPPPLAAALGKQLRKALQSTHEKQMAGLAAQMGC